MKIKKIFLFLLLVIGLEILAVGKLPKNLFNSDKINILKRGILNGPINVYYPNGKIKVKQFFINNRRAGIWQYYYENGKLKAEIIYNMMSNDEEGVIKTYDEKGKIIFQVTERDLANRFQEIQQEINDDRIRANEDKNWWNRW